MADDLETLRMLRAMFTGSVPDDKSNGAAKEFIKDELPTSPAYRDAVPTEKPLERVEAPWEMLLPAVRALKAAKLIKAGSKIKDLDIIKTLLREEPASKKLMQRIEPKVRSTTGYSKKSTEAILRDLNRKNPRSKRMYERIDKIDLDKSHLPGHHGRPTIYSVLDSLGYKGKIPLVGIDLSDPKSLDEVIISPYGKMTVREFIHLPIDY